MYHCENIKVRRVNGAGVVDVAFGGLWALLGELVRGLLKYLLIAPFLGLAGCQNNIESGGARRVGAVQDYIVVFRDTQVKAHSIQLGDLFHKSEVVRSMANEIDRDYSIGAARMFYSATLSGMAISLNETQVSQLSKDERVAYVEPDGVVYANAIQNNPPWGLDRLDQVSLPLNSQYESPNGAANSPVRVYVIDTGVLVTHNEFEGRASHGFDFVNSDSDVSDCNGHGTHVAAIVAGKTYGVAKNASIVGVRVLDCFGSGSISSVIAGIDWVAQNHVGPAVANMSLGGSPSQALDDAVRAAILSGITFVVAAGNENNLACSSSPARTPEAITVGATTRTDARSSFSNMGSCVDIFAPGTDIISAWYNSNTASKTISGTSMASPHVAGAAALFLAANPQASPQQISAALVSAASQNLISGVGAGSPNRLLNISFLNTPPNGPPVVDPPGVDDPPVDNSVIELRNHQVVSGLSGAKDSSKEFKIRLPSKVKNLAVRINGDLGDVDLYVRSTQMPTAENYDCRPYSYNSNEECILDAPQSGEWYILLRGFSAYTALTLRVDFEVEVDEVGCFGCEVFSGELLEAGTSIYAPSSTPYEAKAGEHVYNLNGPLGTDFDLYLSYWNGSAWSEVARSIGSTSIEKIVYRGQSGRYLLRVRSYRGVGAFRLYREYPRP